MIHAPRAMDRPLPLLLQATLLHLRYPDQGSATIHSVFLPSTEGAGVTPSVQLRWQGPQPDDTCLWMLWGAGLAVRELRRLSATGSPDERWELEEIRGVVRATLEGVPLADHPHLGELADVGAGAEALAAVLHEYWPTISARGVMIARETSVAPLVAICAPGDLIIENDVGHYDEGLLID